MAVGSAVPAGLRQLSRVMAWFSTAGFVFVPASLVFTFLLPRHGGWLSFDWNHLNDGLSAAVPLAYRIGALVFALGGGAFTMWALWSLRRLFLHYADGDVFSHAALGALNHVAVALFAGVVVGFAVQAPISLLLSWHLGSGHRAISLGFGSDDVARLFMAGVVLVIARVMAQARRLADENEGFV